MVQNSPWRTNLRDPLAERMLGPGGTHALETVDVAGYPQQVFKGAPRNLAGLYRQAMVFGDKPMVVQDDQSLTYDAAFAQAAALADALRSRFGVKAGTKVAVVTSNRIEWIISVMAITAVGGVAALVNSRGVADEMLRSIGTAQCELAILDAERAVAQTVARFGGIDALVLKLGGELAGVEVDGDVIRAGAGARSAWIEPVAA